MIFTKALKLLTCMGYRRKRVTLTDSMSSDLAHNRKPAVHVPGRGRPANEEQKKSGRPAPALHLVEDAPVYSGRSSLKVRWPEIIVETIDCRDMISSRIAA